MQENGYIVRGVHSDVFQATLQVMILALNIILVNKRQASVTYSAMH